LTKSQSAALDAIRAAGGSVTMDARGRWVGVKVNSTTLVSLVDKGLVSPPVGWSSPVRTPGVYRLIGVGSATSSSPIERGSPLPALAPGPTRFRLGDLPRDMREELFGLHAVGVNPRATQRGFDAKIVPMRFVDVSGVDVSSYPSHAVASYVPETLPPIVVADGKLVDGGHRVAAAQRRGIRRLWAVDLTGVIDPQRTGYAADL
jgi:hypothetical protein